MSGQVTYGVSLGNGCRLIVEDCAALEGTAGMVIEEDDGDLYGALDATQVAALTDGGSTALHKHSDVTTESMTLRVSTAGDDTDGDGTISNPYASLARAMADVPLVVAHPIRIQIEAGEYAGGFPRYIGPTIVGGGSLTIHGVGAPEQKAEHGGPHAVTGVAVTDLSQVVTIGAAIGWAADEFCGYWMRVVAGGHVGRAWPVFGNAAAGVVTITLDLTGDCVENGDTVEFIKPSVSIVVDTDVDICCDDRSVASNVDGGFSRLTLANLNLDASGSANAWGQFKIHGGGAQAGPCLDFVSFSALDYGVYIADTHINYFPPVDLAYVEESLTDIVNLGEANVGATFLNTTGRAAVAAMLFGNAVVYGVSIQGQVEAHYCGYVQYSASAAASFKASDSCSGGSVYAWLSGVDENTPACLLLGGTWSDVLVDVAGDCDYAIDTDLGAIVRVHGECTCSAVLCDHSALRIGPMCKVTTDHALAGFLAAQAGQCAYIFKMATGVKAATWPAAGTYVTDAKGGEFLRVS